MFRDGSYIMFWRYGLRFFDNGQLSIKHSIMYWNGLFARSELRPIEAEVKKRVVVLQVIRTCFQQSRSPFQSARKARRPRSLSGVQSGKLLINNRTDKALLYEVHSIDRPDTEQTCLR